jgi:hypothetical protein
VDPGFGRIQDLGGYRIWVDPGFGRIQDLGKEGALHIKIQFQRFFKLKKIHGQSAHRLSPLDPCLLKETYNVVEKKYANNRKKALR